jgi:hypothetical protein
MLSPVRHRPLSGAHRAAVACILATLVVLTQSSTAWAALSFSSAPALPTLPTVVLNGQAQTTTTGMTNFAIGNSTAGVAWHLNVNGVAGGGSSAVFKQYCPNATCGTDTGPGYVPGGYTLPADSLTLNTTGASWTGGAPRPTYQCGGGCFIDNATAVKVVSSATTVASGNWITTGFSAASLSLSTPSTLRKLQAAEYYKVNVVWTLTAGP